MNIIEDPWMPVIRRDGSSEKIAPCNLTSDYDNNPIIDFCCARPDFQGSLYQFMIGLYQTAQLIKNEEQVEEVLTSPLSPDQLQKAINPFASFFKFDKGDVLFLQDFNLPDCSPSSISGLLIDSPGENTVKQNKDLFIKRDRINAICPNCCAIALFTMQSSAPAGGAGFRTSLRGGGPLNTLVKIESGKPDEKGERRPTSLWQNIVINIIPSDKVKTELKTGDWNLEEPGFIFPWLKETTTSEANTGRPTRPDDIHPFQMFWGMPRRIRIDFENRVNGKCDLCGVKHEGLITHFYQKNYGINYDGAYFHPFSPYLIKKDLPTALHPQPGGIGYQHFPGIAVKDSERGVDKAHVVKNCSTYQDLSAFNKRFRIWAFGYDMDNMKARNWYEANMPLYSFNKVDEDEFFCRARLMIKIASDLLYQLRLRVQDACFSSGDKRSKDFFKKSFWTQIQLEYWKVSESEFYLKSDQVYEAMIKDNTEESERIVLDWYKFIKHLCFKLFDQAVLSGEFEQNNPRRVIEAEIMLHSFLNSKKFSEKYTL